MSGWQPQGYDPRQQRPAVPDQWGQREDSWRASQDPRYQPAPPPYNPNAALTGYAGQRQAPAAPQPYARPRNPGLTAAGSFWYVLGCIPMGAMYFAKVPAKKALQDAGMAQMTAAEQFWYVLMCIGFGAGYFAKLPVAKALSEMRR
jgi:hypothetical protein